MLHLLFALLSVSEAARAAGLFPSPDDLTADERRHALLDRAVLDALVDGSDRATAASGADGLGVR